MSDLEFNTTSGQTVDRELLIAYLNTGTSTVPVWSPLGTRVTDSSMEYDWQEESNKDILGTTRTTMKKPIITQTFDPCDLDAGDAAVVKIWNLAVKEQNAAALANQDMLIGCICTPEPRTRRPLQSATAPVWSSRPVLAARVAALWECLWTLHTAEPAR